MAQNQMRKRHADLRIVLLGKTGVGKSASGNTILGWKAFESKTTACSLTRECKKDRAEVDGRNVYVVDTPDLFDTSYSAEVNKNNILMCISLSNPGPHVFLVVIELGRFTQEEQDTVKLIKKIFGKESAKYTIVLFTHGEHLEGTSIEAFLSHNKALTEFIAQCHGGYHVFKNRVPDYCSQVTQLLQKIDKMVANNGGGHYSSEMYQQAEAELGKQILKEIEENRKREEELLEQQATGNVELGEAIEEFSKRQEEKAIQQNMQTNAIVGAITGLITGAVAGSFLAVGAVTGAAGGAFGGAGVAAAVGAVREQTDIAVAASRVGARLQGAWEYICMTIAGPSQGEHQ